MQGCICSTSGTGGETLDIEDVFQSEPFAGKRLIRGSFGRIKARRYWYAGNRWDLEPEIAIQPS
jgi:hypothetical protein